MKIGIIGLGLMGGSFGRTLLKNGGHTVYGTDQSETVIEKAFLLNAISDRLTEENAGQIDLLIVALYPRDFVDAVQPVLPLLKDGAIVMDFCGVKRGVVKEMGQLAKQYPALRFLGGHPMAGREFWGIAHAIATLFDRASMLLVPVSIPLEALSELKTFFLSLGFLRVVVTTAETHDETIALTSQLAHVISSAYVKSPRALMHTGYSAGSFRDMTRVAKLNADMWSELMTDNADYLLKEIDELICHLSDYRDALAVGDEARLRALLQEGSNLKESLDKH